MIKKGDNLANWKDVQNHIVFDARYQTVTNPDLCIVCQSQIFLEFIEKSMFPAGQMN